MFRAVFKKSAFAKLRAKRRNCDDVRRRYTHTVCMTDGFASYRCRANYFASSHVECESILFTGSFAGARVPTVIQAVSHALLGSRRDAKAHVPLSHRSALGIGDARVDGR